MIEPTHNRCGRLIQEIPGEGQKGDVHDYGSINAAKRESRKIGLGKIRTVPKLHDIGTVVIKYHAKSEHHKED
jgi:hypothetical protein